MAARERTAYLIGTPPYRPPIVNQWTIARRDRTNFQPIYTTPTTLKNTVVSFNLVHGTKKVFHDGGSIYNLSAKPGPKLKVPFDGSVVSHFISLPGVTMSN